MATRAGSVARGGEGAGWPARWLPCRLGGSVAGRGQGAGWPAQRARVQVGRVGQKPHLEGTLTKYPRGERAEGQSTAQMQAPFQLRMRCWWALSRSPEIEVWRRSWRSRIRKKRQNADIRNRQNKPNSQLHFILLAAKPLSQKNPKRHFVLPRFFELQRWANIPHLRPFRTYPMHWHRWPARWPSEGQYGPVKATEPRAGRAGGRAGGRGAREGGYPGSGDLNEC